jgi:choline dehydrogenase-like flavoprotein
MFDDARESGPTAISATTCIIGGGPAGLTVASLLADGGDDVVVIEAGGFPYDRNDVTTMPAALRDHLVGAQSLTRGRNVGFPYFALRFAGATGLGGSTNALHSHGLRSRPLDPIDFEARRGPGWPIDYTEVAQYLPTAAELCGIEGSHTWTPVPVEADSGSGTGSDALVAAPVHHGQRRAFPDLALRLVRDDVRVLVHAPVLGLETVGSRVVAARVAAPARGGITVRAERFVIAASGIGSARLLLACPDVMALLGCSAAHVGAGFMEHPHLFAGHLMPTSDDVAFNLQELFGAPEPTNVVTLADDVVRTEGLHRAGFVGIPASSRSLLSGAVAARSLSLMAPYGPYALGPRAREVLQVALSAPDLAKVALRAARSRMVPRPSVNPESSAPAQVFALYAMTEQDRDLRSRVSLSQRRGRNGLPLPELRWFVSDAERRSLQRSLVLLSEEAERLGWGRVTPFGPAAGEPFRIVRGGWHQMGTVAMAEHPRDGVSDGNGRIFGVDNLYVAGSGSFPTSGYANPTLTLVALAVRLAVHLGARLPAGVAPSASP